MNKVCFVILHYKDETITEKCVASIREMEDQDRIHILILDNDIQEEPEKRRAFARRFPKGSNITVLPMEGEGGFSQANNRGYAYAREVWKASVIIAANNDILFPQKDFIRRLDHILEKETCHLLGPDIIRSYDGQHQNPMAAEPRTEKQVRHTIRMNRLAQMFFPVFYPVLRRQLKAQEQQPLDSIPYQTRQRDMVLFGACLIFTPEFTRTEKLAFTPETRFFYEEYILSRRLKKKGWHTLYDPSLQVIHQNSASTKMTYKKDAGRLRFMVDRTLEAARVYLNMILEDKK